jgi:transposase-like protein
MATKRYSVEERAQALAVLQANAGNLKKTQRDTGIPRKTLAGWRDGNNKDHAQVLEQVPAKCEDLAAKLDAIAGKLTRVTELKLDNLLSGDDDIAKVNIKDLSLATSNTVQTTNLLRHKPTSISETRTTDAKRYEAIISNFLEQAAKNGAPVEREEAINLLSIHLPDIRQVVDATQLVT